MLPSVCLILSPHSSASPCETWSVILVVHVLDEEEMSPGRWMLPNQRRSLWRVIRNTVELMLGREAFQRAMWYNVPTSVTSPERLLSPRIVPESRLASI